MFVSFAWEILLNFSFEIASSLLNNFPLFSRYTFPRAFQVFFIPTFFSLSLLPYFPSFSFTLSHLFYAPTFSSHPSTDFPTLLSRPYRFIIFRYTRIPYYIQSFSPSPQLSSISIFPTILPNYIPSSLVTSSRFQILISRRFEQSIFNFKSHISSFKFLFRSPISEIIRSFSVENREQISRKLPIDIPLRFVYK